MVDQSGSSAALLTSIAAVINAVAWPVVAAWVLFTHRSGLSHLLEIFGTKISSFKDGEPDKDTLDVLNEALFLVR